MLGLPYAFASHFAPQQMMEAIDVYRSTFRPSERLDKPYVMLGFNAFAADTNDEGERIASSMQQTFVNLRSDQPTPLQPPVGGYKQSLPRPPHALLHPPPPFSAMRATGTGAVHRWTTQKQPG